MLPLRMLANIFLRPQIYGGSKEFLFRPHLRNAKRNFVVVDVRDREGTFRSSLRLRQKSTDIETFQQIFLHGSYQTRYLARRADIDAWYQSRAKPLILDLGANVGLSALYFAKNWPRATVIGVEPDAENYALFVTNVSCHKNVIPIRGAIASEPGYARIVNPKASEWAYRTEVTASNTDLPAVSVPELLDRSGDCDPFLCKIDIEGAEDELFSSNTEWVTRFPVIMIELHDWMLPQSGSSTNFLRTIVNMERDFVLNGENIFSIAHDS